MGGKNKTFSQIKDVKESYLASLTPIAPAWECISAYYLRIDYDYRMRIPSRTDTNEEKYGMLSTLNVRGRPRKDV